MNELFHPDHELISLTGALGGRSHRGASGYREWQEDLDEAVHRESRLVEALDLDDDRVLSILAISIRGRGSGIDLGEKRYASVSTVRDG